MTIRMKALAPVCMLAMLTACSDGLLHEPAPPAPGSVAFSASMLQGGTAEAYAQANTLWFRFSEGEETRLENTIPFNSDAEQVRVSVQVPLRDASETFFLEMELRRDADPIFEAATEVVLTGGETSQVDIPLQPIVAGVACSGLDVELDAHGATAQLTAAALFVTGDTVPAASIQWSTGSESPVTVNDAGVVTAQRDGTATVTCAAGGATDTRNVIVSAVVTTVSVEPSQTAVIVGGTATFTATARDRLENVITGRTTSWSSSAPAIATVTQAGVATGESAGTARIDATVDGVTGSGTITVSFPPPGVTTGTASDVTGVDATLNGTVDTRGTATSAWFEYGTSPTLATFTATTTQSVEGTSVHSVSEAVSGLSEATIYYVRAAATNAGGTTRGRIVSFTTAPPGPPSVRTVSAYYVPDSDAFLEMNGAVTPNGSLTDVYFEWSQVDSTLTRPQITKPQPMDAGWTEVPFTDGFFSNYEATWVRAVAVNQYGTVRGAIIKVDEVIFGSPEGVPAGSATRSSSRRQ